MTWRRLLRFARNGLFALLLLLALAGGAIAGAIWWTVPPDTSRARIPGLSGPVSIRLDPDGIPWITAGSEADAAAALGWMHARDRMFQMELMRRAASGRLSELVGPATLPLDRANRTLGLRQRAEEDVASLDPDALRLLQAYARGVNSYIEQRGRFTAPEFLLLGQPEPWRPADSLLWGKTMAQYLSGDWRGELTRAALAPRLSPPVRKALWPSWLGTLPPDAALLPDTRLGALVPSFPAPFTLPGVASNEWAVDGAHSRSGAPLLAGDPHLALGFPSIWYLARVQTPAGVLAGAFAPGVPFLVIGHNGRIAWTFTTTGADTQDVFVETPVGSGLYATPDGPKPFLEREERIVVRGEPDSPIRIRSTRHGPVLSDLDPAPGPEPHPILAVSMASLMVPDTSAAGLLALNRAGSVAEAGRAGTAISAPVQNLLVADRAGIGQFTTGRVPLRRSGDGSVPSDGADGRHDWIGFAAGLQLPHVIAPESGRIVNANEPVAPPNFPVFMGADGFGDWRARRIRAMLAAQPQHDKSEFEAMQVDVVSDFAEEILPVLLRTAAKDAASQRVLDTLRGWNGAMRMDAPQPLPFTIWTRRLRTDVLAELGLAGAPIGNTTDLVGQALVRGGDALCGGSCDDLLSRSLAETAEVLPAGYEGLRWGDLHQAVFSHPLLGRLPVIGALASWAIAQPGDDSTVFRASMRPPGFTAVHGPAYRGVYDLADLDGSLFGLAPGESGNPFSGRAASTLARWRDGVPIRLGPAPDTVAGTIELRP